MKKYYFIQFVFFIASFSSVYSQSTTNIPQYTLEAKNFKLISSNQMTFDLVFTKTDSIPLELASWQFNFKIPVGFGTLGFLTGVNSSFVYDSIGGDAISDFPNSYRPRNLSVIDIEETHYGLRTLPFITGTGGGLLLPHGVPLLIGRFKLKSTTPINVSVLIPNHFIIRDSCETPLPVIRTKLNYYNENSFNQEFTRCTNHSVDISGILPKIEMNVNLAIEGLYDPLSDLSLRKDTVTAYLRNVNSPYQIIDSSRSVIDSISHIGNFIFVNQSAGSYYFSVRNKRIIETWSEAGGTYLTNEINYYDFTASASKAYGDNMVLIGSRYCIYTGDVNNDQIIDSDDLAMVDNDVYNFSFGNTVTDLNGDNVVDIDDLVIVDRNAENLVMMEWPGMTLQKKNNLLKKGQFVKKKN
ncbi:MAG: hypothetical protein IPM96_12955 [Ignavibacteria bacterium]|nr:hypothetical protein [Ignavibacteria bacterium]